MNEDTILPTQFSHSVKIEQTVKGANEGLEALQQSINLYRATRLELERLKEVVAPIEIKT
jgi:hypothetical protein